MMTTKLYALWEEVHRQLAAVVHHAEGYIFQRLSALK
jgi:hypothetical protein